MSSTTALCRRCEPLQIASADATAVLPEGTSGSTAQGGVIERGADAVSPFRIEAGAVEWIEPPTPCGTICDGGAGIYPAAPPQCTRNGPEGYAPPVFMQSWIGAAGLFAIRNPIFIVGHTYPGPNAPASGQGVRAAADGTSTAVPDGALASQGRAIRLYRQERIH